MLFYDNTHLLTLIWAFVALLGISSGRSAQGNLLSFMGQNKNRDETVGNIYFGFIHRLFSRLLKEL